MKSTEIYEASTLARTVSKSLDIAVAMADYGHDADAQYRVNIAHAAFMSLADQLGYRVEKITADPARTLAYVDAGRPVRGANLSEVSA
ncbi:hypothetical protein [Rhizobium sp. LC145]|uniref:hypothetical protein n=1 Tax=Rhizobium sp. LC145 TaxID=1120688 RepID=UPI00062A253C|nr:hypothetical protein [Rhizobium sp. LC145]KKX29222.1 hypothetical protein YH62_15595 [Rhizobium sp. LC145]TKT68821.1 hypothetical protein FDR95_00125 [Rhizobiaceae bacterium LC148]